MVLLLPLFSTAFIVLSAIFVAFGWVAVARGQLEKHKKLMITAAVFALAFFIIYLSRTVFIGNTAFGGPEDVKTAYTIFLFFHIFLATVGAIFGIVTLLHGFKGRIILHKKLGPWTSIIWFFTAATGVVVYLLLYVIYPPGKTESMIKAILGF